MDPIAAALTALLLGAVAADVGAQRIPNVLTLGGAAFALLLQFITSGWAGLASGIQGLTVGLVLFLPLYVFASMGAGDVKLMAAVGAFLGPWQALLAGVCSIAAGGALAILYITLKGDLIRTFRRYADIIGHVLITRQFYYLKPRPGEAAGRRLAFAPAIALGTAASLYVAVP